MCNCAAHIITITITHGLCSKQDAGRHQGWEEFLSFEILVEMIEADCWLMFYCATQEIGQLLVKSTLVVSSHKIYQQQWGLGSQA